MRLGIKVKHERFAMNRVFLNPARSKSWQAFRAGKPAIDLQKIAVGFFRADLYRDTVQHFLCAPNLVPATFPLHAVQDGFRTG